MYVDNVADDLMQDVIETNFNFYKQFADDEEFKNMLINFLFKRFAERSNKLAG